jgi:hypothetical protein
VGVIHHSPDTENAFSEIARVTRRGGTVKLMLYHRHSLVALYLWVRYALLRGRPWRSLSDVVYHHMESIGTRAYTRSEIREMAKRHRLSVRNIDVVADLRSARAVSVAVTRGRLCTCLAARSQPVRMVHAGRIHQMTHTPR